MDNEFRNNRAVKFYKNCEELQGEGGGLFYKSQGENVTFDLQGKNLFIKNHAD